MKTITQATEKRINNMVKRDHRFGNLLKWMLDEMKSAEGWYGASLKEMKRYGVELDNDREINAYECDAPLMNALAWLYPDYFYCSFCLNLHFAHIKDFNKLVKVVDEMKANGWGVYSRA